MVGVAVSALILRLIPICWDLGWTWYLIRDVKRGGKTARQSANVLSHRSSGAVSALRDALRSDKSSSREAAAEALGMIGSKAKDAVPDLIDALRDKDDGVRMWAAIALGRIGPDAVSAVEPLLASVQDEEHPVVIVSAIKTLGEIGPVARPALPVLALLVNDPQHRNHVMAVCAFWRIGPKGRAEATIVVPKLIDRLSTSKHPRERAWVAEILSEIGLPAREAISALSTAAGDPEQEVRFAASNALRALTGASANPESDVPTATRNP
jgi:HEAT repeat protein